MSFCVEGQAIPYKLLVFPPGKRTGKRTGSHRRRLKDQHGLPPGLCRTMPALHVAPLEDEVFIGAQRQPFLLSSFDDHLTERGVNVDNDLSARL